MREINKNKIQKWQNKTKSTPERLARDFQCTETRPKTATETSKAPDGKREAKRPSEASDYVLCIKKVSPGSFHSVSDVLQEHHESPCPISRQGWTRRRHSLLEILFHRDTLTGTRMHVLCVGFSLLSWWCRCGCVLCMDSCGLCERRVCGHVALKLFCIIAVLL